MANNKLSDVKDVLIAQLQDLSDTDLTDEQLDKEIKRSKAMIGVAGQITSIYNTSLNAMQIAAQGKFIDTTKVTEQFKLEQ